MMRNVPVLRFNHISRDVRTCGEPAVHGSVFVLHFDCHDSILEQLVPIFLSEVFRRNLAGFLDVGVVSVEVATSESPVGGSDGNLTICGSLAGDDQAMRHTMVHPLTALAVAEDLEEHFGFSSTEILKIAKGHGTCKLGAASGHPYWITFRAAGSSSQLSALRQVGGEEAQPVHLLQEFVASRDVQVLWLQLVWGVNISAADSPNWRDESVNLTFTSVDDSAEPLPEDSWPLPLLIVLPAAVVATVMAVVALFVFRRARHSSSEECASMKASAAPTGGDSAPSCAAIGVESA